MAVPTITTISPAVGAPTGGQALEIIGTGFRLPTAPAPGIVPVPVAPDPVRAFIGGTQAEVRVISSTRLFVFTPKRSMPIDSKGNTAGTENVDVTVENIDDAGVLIPGETVTTVDGYQYKRPGVTSEDSGDFLGVVATLVDLLRSEVLANTVIDTSSDFDPDTGLPQIPVEETPQLILTGPEIVENKFFTFRGPVQVPGINAGEVFKQRRHRVVDLGFEVMGIANTSMELINLMGLFETVIDRNVELEVPVAAALPAGSTIPLEFHIVKSPVYERTENYLADNLRVFTASVVLKGWPFACLPGVDQDAVQDVAAEWTTDPQLDSVLEPALQIGEDLPATQGAPTRSPPDPDAVP